MYKMYNCSFFELENIDGDYEPLTLEVDSNMTNKFNIEELDSITSRYKSEEDFYNALLNDKIIDGTKKDIIIVHESNNRLYNDEVLYNNSLVYEVATQVKNSKKNEKNSVIKNTHNLFLFIQYIEKILESDKYKYLIDPKSIKYLTSTDANNLSLCIGKDIVVDGKTVKKGIQTLLEEYKEASLKNQECILRGYNNFQTDSLLNKSRDNIINCIRSNYKIFRDLVAWNNRYVKVLNKQYHDSTNNTDKLNYFKLMEDVDIEKDYWTGIIDIGQLNKYYNQCRDAISIDEFGQIKSDGIKDIEINNSINQQINRISSSGRK